MKSADVEGLVTERIAEARARLAALPSKQLSHLPTPLDDAPRLSQALGRDDIWIKRDDCTGLAFGGNKARQLEYVLGDAIAEGADCIIQGAGSQSNHARQLAAAAAKLGIDCYLTPRQDKYSDPVQGNYLVAKLLTEHMHPIGANDSAKDAKEALAAKLRAEGRTPYIVGMGAKKALALAAVAYVGAFLEIVEQLAAAGRPAPAYVFVTSQGSNQAGLQLGAHMLGLSTQIVGINPMAADNEAYVDPRGIHEMLLQAAELLGYPCDIREDEIVNLTDYVGPAYARPSEAGLEAMRLLAGTEGILVDPVYSGKGLSGFVDHARNGKLGETGPAVFLHTGGLPALFTYSEEII